MAQTFVKEIIKEVPVFVQLTDLAAERLGGKVLYATDDFFAESIPIAVSGWMAGRAAASGCRGTTVLLWHWQRRAGYMDLI